MFHLYISLNVIILYLTNVQHVLDRVLSEKSAKCYLCLITKLPKMVKTVIFLRFCVSNLLMQYGGIEINPGLKYSSLSFCQWSFNCLNAITCAIQGTNTPQKMKFSIKEFFSKYDQIRLKLRILSHLLKKYLMENLIFDALKKINMN